MLSCSLFSLRRSPLTRKLCLVTAFSLLLQVVLPVTTFALTSGPAAPEFSSFEPVATTDMVNDFTGDFTYNVPVINIPGPDGGGYALSLSYHAGVSPEEEASWVGFGWTLNPGAVNRQKRGFPDDFNGKPIQRYNKTKPNWTQSAAFSVNMEYNSVDKEKKSPGEGQEKATGFLNTKINKNNAGFKMKMPWQKDDDDADFPISVSLSKSVRYNNYSGFSIANGFGSNVKGLVQLNMNQSGGETTYGITIPATLIAKIWKNRIDKLNSEAAKSFTDGKITDGLQKNVQSTKLKKSYSTTNKLGLFGASYGAWSFNAPAVPYSIAYTVGRAWNFSTSVELNPYGPIGFQVGLAGNFNTQVNVPRTDITAFGYMYNPNFSSTYSDRVSNTYGDAVNHLIPEADFQLEKASTFNKHDRNLGIPFANADIFSGSGNEAIGGFRFFHRDIGNFYPTPVTNKQQIHQKGVELGIGGTIQIGLDVGLGLQKTQVERWKNLDPTTTLTNYNPQFGSTTPLLQFMNDAGGELRYSDNDKLQYAKIGLGRALDGNTLSGQTQMITSRQGQTAPITYDKDSDGKISAISVINQDGTRSKYGENIQVKSETELTIGVEGLDFPKNRYLVHPGTPVYETDPLKNQIAVGMKSDQNYASTWLLTETTSFDYVDVNPNGADNNDFGGWTKFSYRKAHEDYRFRAPYTGLLYNRGNLYDLHDQTGGYSAGVKQVKYLSQIETKSHIAFFVTNKTKGNLLDLSSLNLSQADKTALEAQLNGSDQNRFDGLDAIAVNTAPNTGDDPAATDNTAKGSHRLEYLERIVLYAKSNLKTPITTTFFEYDYSLCKGLPNSDATTAAQSGKLTLKRVWTEAYGAFQSRIAPYRFEYTYPAVDYPQAVLNKYPGLKKVLNGMPPGLVENPDYKPEWLDAWGYCQPNGATRFQYMQPWLSQRPTPATFDPAAWNLKRIILPSGGEIHVQYEQKDYRYVQDKRAMAMVSLLPNAQINNAYKGGDAVYVINKTDLNVASTAEVADYVNLLRDYFINDKNKLYYKVLYAYSGTPNSLNDLSNLSQTDYISGYTVVDKVEATAQEIYLYLGERDKQGNPKKDPTLPRYLCYRKLLTESGDNLGKTAKDQQIKDEEHLNDAYKNLAQPNTYEDKLKDNLKDIGRGEAASGAFNMFIDWVSGNVANPKREDACKELAPQFSYFKLPVFKAKKGGGIRVKRLLLYDPGIGGDTGEAMVYGSEYKYEMPDGSSSGVAVNEPQSMREENPLVSVVERKRQKLLNKLTNGRDTKEFEGPIGENLLPAASVAYERIVIKNIHSGKTGTGFQVNTYHTVRTNPTVTVEYSDLSKKDDTYKKFNVSLPLGLINYNVNKAWVTQGYLFKISDMHGKPLSQATYAGDYNQPTFNSAAYTAATFYRYSQPGEKVKTLVYNPTLKKLEETPMALGTTEDIAMYESSVSDISNDFSLELDLDITLCCAVTLGFGLTYDRSEQELNQHVTSKVLWQKSYLLATTTVADGVTQTTQNVAFNRQNGEPVLTCTYDGFMEPQEPIHTEKSGSLRHDGYYYTLNVPASWMFPTMGKRFNQGVENPANSNQLSASAGKVVTYGASPVTAGLIGRVVSAEATIYKNDWFNSNLNQTMLDADFGLNALAKQALNKHWYPLRSYVYRDAVTDANSAADRIYSGGLYGVNNSIDFWGVYTGNSANTIINNNWFSPSQIVSYSPHGYPMEEVDALGVRSIVKFGYNNTLPVLVAQNADYNSAFFYDYEYGPNGTVCLNAHSGSKAFNLSQSPNAALLNGVMTQNVKNKGGSIRLWLHSKVPNSGTKNPNPGLKALVAGKITPFTKVAETGDWALYEARITDWGTLAVNASFAVRLQYNFASNETVWIDDFRFQPLEAAMSCTSYTPDFKVAVQFDDQHFGTYYEYNALGQLVRKSVETERGRKILQEQQSHTPLVIR